MKNIKFKNTIRIILLLSFIILCYQLYEFRFAYRLEVVKDEPNYQGLAVLFAAMISNFIMILIAKMIEKKFEK